KDVVGGYTLIEAEDLSEAVELSKGCPIFEVDGAVEVRPVMKLNMWWSRAITSFGVRRGAWSPRSRACSVVPTRRWRRTSSKTPSAVRWRFGNSRACQKTPPPGLMAVAKNRALDVLRRQRTAQTFAPELGHLLESEWTLAPAVAELFGANVVKDDLLPMRCSCCHARLAGAAQVALILNIVCGFSVGEIGSAFVSGHTTIEKRITRDKKTLAGLKRLFDITAPADFSVRLSAVHRALYLLFNEGYHGASPESAVRTGLCREAM